LKLHLGFEDMPYEARYETESPLAPSVKKRRPKVMSAAQQAYGQGKTTHQVSEELETRYGILEYFFRANEDFIVGIIEEAMYEDIETIMGQKVPPTGGISVEETDKIEARFRRALSNKEFDNRLRGVPTKTAQAGVSHLYKHPYVKRPPRPSFIDTGLYQKTFRAWVEED